MSSVFGRRKAPKVADSVAQAPKVAERPHNATFPLLASGWTTFGVEPGDDNGTEEVERGMGGDP